MPCRQLRCEVALSHAVPRGEGGAQRSERAVVGSQAEAMRQLEAMGARVFKRPPADARESPKTGDWGDLAGYDAVKRQVEDTVLLAITSPETYADIARRTRRAGSGKDSAVPRAVLLEGPPGTGKTTAARVMATAAKVDLVYLPIESVLSKWYGEAEKQLAKTFDLVEQLEQAVLFIDEIDALATSRGGGEMHEATRRVLSVLLRRLDGLETREGGLVIAATNRKQDLDAALRSRFDAAVCFDLPSSADRAKIFAVYAQHLSDDDRRLLADASQSFAGRDIRKACEDAERRWAAAMVRGETGSADDGDLLPPLGSYLEAVRQRKETR